MRATPLIPILLLFIGGIVFARYSSSAVLILLLALIASLPFARRRSFPLLAALIALSGAVVYTVRYAPLSDRDPRVLFADSEALVDIRGLLLDAPEIREYPSRSRTNYTSRARIRVHQIRRGEKWEPALGTIMSSASGILAPEFRPGSLVEVFGVIAPPPSAAAEGLFDYRRHLHHQRIFYQFKSAADEDWRLLRGPEGTWLGWIDRFQRWAQSTLAAGLPRDQNLELIWAMTLGWKTGLDGSVAEHFQRSGTMHIFAISGLHVACIAGALIWVLSGAGLPRSRCCWIALPLLWFYTLATGWQSTAVRAALMSSVLIIGWALKRPSSMLNSTAAAGLLILAFQPEQLFQAGFQLSFLVVATIGLVLPPIEQARRGLLAPDPFLPKQLRPKWRRALDTPVRYVTTGFTISLASFLGALPLVAWYFNLISPVSLLANILAVPLSSIALIAALLSLVIPPLAPVFNYIAWVFMGWTVSVTEFFSTLPLAWFCVGKPGPLFFPFFYGTLLLLLGRRFLAPRLGFVLAIAALGLGWITSSFLASRQTSISILPANGNPVLIDLPGRARDLLIDCSDDRGGEYIVQRFLRARGTGAIANLLVTHGDINHAGAYPLIWRQFTPGMIFTSKARARSPIYRQMIRELENGAAAWTPISKGSLAAGWEVLHPGPRHFPRADDNSVVLKGELRGWRVLLLSEIARPAQRELVRSGADLSADIVLCGSPENEEPLEPELLAAIRPRLIIVGNTSSYSSASAESRLVTRLREAGAPVLCSGRGGFIKLTLTSSACRAQTASGRGLLIAK